MIKKVLVPLDGSNMGEQALIKAKELVGAATPNGVVVALRVMELPQESPLFEPIDLQNARNEERRQANHYLDGIREQYLADDYILETRICDSKSSVAESIVEQAEMEEADLIALTSHGHTGLKRLLLGSVTEKVLRLAPCSVVIVR